MTLSIAAGSRVESRRISAYFDVTDVGPFYRMGAEVEGPMRSVHRRPGTKVPHWFLALLVILLTFPPQAAALAQGAGIPASGSTDGHEAKFADIAGARTR
jgi:hypothetical protein